MAGGRFPQFSRHVGRIPAIRARTSGDDPLGVLLAEVKGRGAPKDFCRPAGFPHCPRPGRPLINPSGSWNSGLREEVVDASLELAPHFFACPPVSAGVPKGHERGIVL